jgi:hypothetical protein
MIFDEHLEAAMDRDARQPRVACLLQPLDQERTEHAFVEHVAVEIRPFDAFRIGQDDLPDPEGRKRRPQTAHDLRPRHRQQQIDVGPVRDRRLERAAQRDGLGMHGLHGAAAERPLDQADAHLLVYRDP